MNSDTKVSVRKPEYVISSIAGILLLLQILLLSFYFNPELNLILLGIGWIMLVPSFLLLMLPAGVLDVFALPTEGQSCSTTEVLKVRGPYSYVRHPLYIGWMLISISLALVSQFWISIFFSIYIIPLVIMLIVLEERSNILKFGDEYLDYQIEVPMVNILAGIFRKVKRKSIT